MNPARSFGPSALGNEWTGYWLLWGEYLMIFSGFAFHCISVTFTDGTHSFSVDITDLAYYIEFC